MSLVLRKSHIEVYLFIFTCEPESKQTDSLIDLFNILFRFLRPEVKNGFRFNPEKPMKTDKQNEDDLPKMTASQAAWLGVAGFFIMLVLQLLAACLLTP